ncbi:MAG TPA: fumarylacetoacetate hydrolase family protein [Candidatus Eisenbacteria bacterium]|nr:fumarylacetoacetate hydrolase family protein [Candidatus Eisenbacteria bacterium]
MRITRFAVGDEVSYGLVGTARAGTAAAGGEVIAELAGHPLGGMDGIRLTGTTYLLEEVRLLAPVLPSKVIGYDPASPGPAGRADDGLDGGSVMYLKPSTAVCGPSDPIRYPAQAHRLRPEGKLAVIIGRLCRQVPPDQAAAVIFGYTCALDVTAADLSERDGQWSRAKGFDTFCPLGPWIETDAGQASLELVTTVNGQVRQRAKVPAPGPDVAALVAFASNVMTLLPGDVLLTGAPAGDGAALKRGDEVSVSIEQIGTLTNRVEQGD